MELAALQVKSDKESKIYSNQSIPGYTLKSEEKYQGTSKPNPSLLWKFATFPEVWRKPEIKDFPETVSNERHTDKIFRNRNRHPLGKTAKSTFGHIQSTFRYINSILFNLIYDSEKHCKLLFSGE